MCRRVRRLSRICDIACAFFRVLLRVVVERSLAGTRRVCGVAVSAVSRVRPSRQSAVIVVDSGFVQVGRGETNM